jgi:anti-anti-sigma factor
MLTDICPVQWTGRQAVLALPEHIDVSNAGPIREELLSVINRGALALIADLTATISCDHAGADALVRAYHRAVISGTELRIAVTAQIVRRVLSLSGLDRLVSIYPSLEAATAARAPATVIPVAATRPEWPAAAITPAVVEKLVDALADGVALTDGDGTLALVNLRLEEMFGYEHAELTGRPVDSLVPADLQAAHRGHRAAYARAPEARPMGAEARLVALRKDGTTFPAEISLSPVTTATAAFTLTVIRDITEPRRLVDLADLARAAVAARQARLGQELLDSVTASLYTLGLSLQAAADLPHDAASESIAEALRHLDDTIRQIRDTTFAILRPENLSRTLKRCRVTQRRGLPGPPGRPLHQGRGLKAVVPVDDVNPG